MIAYLDTSAAMKLLVEDVESHALVSYLTSAGADRHLVSSWLLHTELHCAVKSQGPANRHPRSIDAAAVAAVLETTTLIELSRGDVLTAGALPGRLRSNDAIHLATALRVGADEMITYDAELAAASTLAGIAVIRPA